LEKHCQEFSFEFSDFWDNQVPRIHEHQVETVQYPFATPNVTYLTLQSGGVYNDDMYESESTDDDLTADVDMTSCS
jgi:hypothetical protein